MRGSERRMEQDFPVQAIFCQFILSLRKGDKGFIYRGRPPGVPYTPKPPHFHQLTQFVDIFTASTEKGREREERLIFREFLQMCPNSERL